MTTQDERVTKTAELILRVGAAESETHATICRFRAAIKTDGAFSRRAGEGTGASLLQAGAAESVRQARQACHDAFDRQLDAEQALYEFSNQDLWAIADETSRPS